MLSVIGIEPFQDAHIAIFTDGNMKWICKFDASTYSITDYADSIVKLNLQKEFDNALEDSLYKEVLEISRRWESGLTK